MPSPVKRVVIAWGLFAGATLGAQGPVLFDSVAPGVGYARLERAAGPWVAHVVRIDRAAGSWTVIARHAGDSVRSRETTSAIAGRAARAASPSGAAPTDVIAALNADFFDLRTGEVTDHQVIDGAVWKAIHGFPVRNGRWRSRGQFAVAADGRPVVGRFRYAGTVTVGGQAFRLDGVNGIPREGVALIHFDRRWGALPVADSSRRATVDTTVQGVRLVAYEAGGRARLDSLVAAVRRRWRPDARLRLVHHFEEGDPGAVLTPGAEALRPTTLVGGWGILVRDGRDVSALTDSVERTAPSLSAQRHPRSAIGTSDGGRIIWLIAVDGRQAASVGMTFAELAALMRELGVEEGLNLDGGGSTALWVAGAIRNHPSDPTGERSVGNVLLVVRR